jgi:hypothetical protein
MWRVCQPYAGAVRLCFNVERSSTHALKPEGTTRANAQVRGTNYSRTQLPELTEASGLNNYLAYAALANPQLEAAFNRWKAALEMVTQAHTLPDPRFNYGYFIQEVETRVGPQEQRPGLSQMFPWFGKLKLRSEAAREGTNAALQQYEAAKLKLFDEVKWCYEPGCEGEHHECETIRHHEPRVGGPNISVENRFRFAAMDTWFAVAPQDEHKTIHENDQQL